MAKTSFANLEEEETPKTKKAATKKAATKKAATKNEVAEVELEEVAEEPKAELATTTSATGMTGEWNKEDLELPRLNLVAKTSELVDEGYTPGAWIISKEMEFAQKETPVEVIVLAMDKKYQEDVPYGSDEMPQMWATKQDMFEAGFSDEYGSENYAQPLANFTLLVGLPDDVEDDAGYFNHEIDGKFYALVVYTAAKTGYKTTAKVVASHMAFSGCGSTADVKFILTSKIKTYGDNSWFAPFFKKAGPVSEAQAEFIASMGV